MMPHCVYSLSMIGPVNMRMGLVGVLAMAVLASAKPDTTPKLFSLTGDDTSKLKACQGNQHEVLQCDRINFNLEIFNSDKIALPGFDFFSYFSFV